MTSLTHEIRNLILEYGPCQPYLNDMPERFSQRLTKEVSMTFTITKFILIKLNTIEIGFLIHRVKIKFIARTVFCLVPVYIVP